MVVIQPSTGKMIIVEETKKHYCFLPRGRKDLGETLQQAAVREAYEESGYQVEHFPLFKHNHQPAPPNDQEAYGRPDTEPIYMTVDTWGPKVRRGQVIDVGGEYFISWFVGQIPANAVHHEGVGMPDEQNYKSHLVTFEEALHCLGDTEKAVVRYAHHVYKKHLHALEMLALEQLEGEGDERTAVESNGGSPQSSSS